MKWAHLEIRTDLERAGQNGDWQPSFPLPAFTSFVGNHGASPVCGHGLTHEALTREIIGCAM
jgi:hypothetical protein